MRSAVRLESMHQNNPQPPLTPRIRCRVSRYRPYRELIGTHRSSPLDSSSSRAFLPARGGLPGLPAFRSARCAMYLAISLRLYTPRDSGFGKSTSFQAYCRTDCTRTFISSAISGTVITSRETRRRFSISSSDSTNPPCHLLGFKKPVPFTRPASKLLYRLSIN